jgi:hypothetical protein
MSISNDSTITGDNNFEPILCVWAEFISHPLLRKGWSTRLFRAALPPWRAEIQNSLAIILIVASEWLLVSAYTYLGVQWL